MRKMPNLSHISIVVLFFGVLTCLALLLTSCSTQQQGIVYPCPFGEDISTLQDMNEYIIYDLNAGNMPEATAKMYVLSNEILIRKLDNIASVTYKQHQ